MTIDLQAIKFLLTLRYNPYSPKEYVIKTEIPEEVKSIDLALSSGIDSHYLLHTIRQERPDLEIKCIYIGFTDGNDERKKAEEIANKYDVLLLVEDEIDDPLEQLPELIKVVGEPRWNLYQYYLYRHVNSILVTGDGGDEVFAGYTFRYKKYLKDECLSIDKVQRAAAYLSCHERDWVWDQNQLFQVSQKTPFYYAHKYLEPYFTRYRDGLDSVINADFNGKLKHDFIPTNYKLSKHLGIEVITPLLKHELRPWQELYDPIRNLGKLPLRRMTNRWDDTKKGFGFDVVKYWNRIGKEKIQPVLDPETAQIFKEIINKEWYLKHKDSQDVRYVNKFLQLFALELYLSVILS